MLNENKINRIIRESIDNFLITESIPSKRLARFFSEHGGVERKCSQDGLGDVTDDQIVSLNEFDNWNDAYDYFYKLRRKNPAKLITMYKAKDGTTAVATFDDSVETTVTWGGVRTKKAGDRAWMRDRDPYYKRNDIYYYGGGREVPANDFGLRTNVNYKGALEDLENSKKRHIDYYTPKSPVDNRSKLKKLLGIGKSKFPSKEEIEAGKKKGEDEYNAWRERELQHMKDYLNNHWKWHRRDWMKDKPRQW